jgi:hypothetical protein
VDVDERVVGHHGPWRAQPELGEVLDRVRQRAGVGVGILAVVLLDVEVAAVIIDS